jgi:hypothetical protein
MVEQLSIPKMEAEEYFETVLPINLLDVASKMAAKSAIPEQMMNCTCITKKTR